MIKDIDYEKRKFYLFISSWTLPLELKKIIWAYHDIKTLNENHHIFKNAHENLLIYDSDLE